MKMELQSTLYKHNEVSRSVRCDNESVNTINMLPSKTKSTSQGFSSSMIQKKFPKIPLDNVSEL